MTRLLLCLLLLCGLAAADSTGAANSDSVAADTTGGVVVAPAPPTASVAPQRTFADSMAIETHRLAEWHFWAQLGYWAIAGVAVAIGFGLTWKRIKASEEAALAPSRDAQFATYMAQFTNRKLDKGVRIAAAIGLQLLAGKKGRVEGDYPLRDSVIALFVESTYTETDKDVLAALRDRLIAIGGPALQPLVDRHRRRVRLQQNRECETTTSVPKPAFEASRDAIVGIIRHLSPSELGWAQPRADRGHHRLVVHLRRGRGTVSTRYLNDSHLHGVCLAWADLWSMSLSGADLSLVGLRGTSLEATDLSLACLTGADLSDVYGKRAILNGADLSKAWVVGANLADASLKRADFTLANLAKASLADCDLSFASFEDANLREAGLGSAVLREAKLLRADLTKSFLGDADLTGAELQQAKLEEADLSHAKLVQADLREADLSKARLLGVDLRGADLSSAQLGFADIRGVDFSGANLTDAALAFTRGYMDAKSWSGADWWRANLLPEDALWFQESYPMPDYAWAELEARNDPPEWFIVLRERKQAPPTDEPDPPAS